MEGQAQLGCANTHEIQESHGSTIQKSKRVESNRGVRQLVTGHNVYVHTVEYSLTPALQGSAHAPCRCHLKGKKPDTRGHLCTILFT